MCVYVCVIETERERKRKGERGRNKKSASCRVMHRERKGEVVGGREVEKLEALIAKNVR